MILCPLVYLISSQVCPLEDRLVEVDAWQIIQVRVIVWKELEGLMMDRKLTREVLNLCIIYAW